MREPLIPPSVTPEISSQPTLRWREMDSNAISRMFAGLINSLSSAPDVVDVVNRQIEQCGYRLISTRRH